MSAAQVVRRSPAKTSRALCAASTTESDSESTTVSAPLASSHCESRLEVRPPPSRRTSSGRSDADSAALRRRTSAWPTTAPAPVQRRFERRIRHHRVPVGVRQREDGGGEAVCCSPRAHHHQPLLRPTQAAAQLAEHRLGRHPKRRRRVEKRAVPPLEGKTLEARHLRGSGLGHQGLAKGDVEVHRARGRASARSHGARDDGAHVLQRRGARFGQAQRSRGPGEAAKEAVLGHRLWRSEAVELPGPVGRHHHQGHVGRPGLHHRRQEVRPSRPGRHHHGRGPPRLQGKSRGEETRRSARR